MSAALPPFNDMTFEQGLGMSAEEIGCMPVVDWSTAERAVEEVLDDFGVDIGDDGKEETVPEYILSIDPGMYNTAIIVVDAYSKLVVFATLMETLVGAKAKGNDVENVCKFYEKLNNLGGMYNITAVLVETQMKNLNLSRVEALSWGWACAYKCICKPTLAVERVSPVASRAYFRIAEANHYRNKKRAIAVADDIMFKLVGVTLKEVCGKILKRDDIADAYLQALMYSGYQDSDCSQ